MNIITRISGIGMVIFIILSTFGQIDFGSSSDGFDGGMRDSSVLSYDDNGNQINYGDTQYTYDAKNRLVETENVYSGDTTRFLYDAFDIKVSRECNGEITFFVDSQEYTESRDLCREYVGPTFVDYTDLGNQVEGIAEIFYYLVDNLGSVFALADENGNIAERYFYEPYGKTTITNSDGSIELDESAYGNEFMWTGQRYDAVNDLYHFWARSYSPDLGRWLHRDPIGYAAGSLNLYEYVSSNPVNFIDPLGLQQSTDDIDIFDIPLNTNGVPVDANANGVPNLNEIQGSIKGRRAREEINPIYEHFSKDLGIEVNKPKSVESSRISKVIELIKRINPEASSDLRTFTFIMGVYHPKPNDEASGVYLDDEVYKRAMLLNPKILKYEEGTGTPEFVALIILHEYRHYLFHNNEGNPHPKNKKELAISEIDAYSYQIEQAKLLKKLYKEYLKDTKRSSDERKRISYRIHLIDKFLEDMEKLLEEYKTDLKNIEKKEAECENIIPTSGPSNSEVNDD